MALPDRFNTLIYAGLLICTLVIGLLLFTDREQSSSAAAVDKALDQQIAYQARIDFLQKLYWPVEELRKQGQTSAALLKLDELARQFPQEAHGELLQGEILFERKAVSEAIKHTVRAVRLNGDYVDEASPLNRYAAIRQLVESQLPIFLAKARKDSQNPALQNSLTGLYYLQSRLAGGCE